MCFNTRRASTRDYTVYIKDHLFPVSCESRNDWKPNVKPNISDYYTMNISQSTVVNTVSQQLILSKRAAGSTRRRKPHIKGHLFPVPCESGNYWKCDVSSCVACPQGFYQPQWGQTSCWPCPFNTTTDFEGASSPTECKREYYIP